MINRATARDIHIAAQRAGRVQRAQQPSTHTLPAPVGGLNGRDALDDMKPEDAVQLDNLFPGFGKVEVRGGTADWATVGSVGFTPATGAVETLAELIRDDGRSLLSAADGGLYDVTAGGEVDTPLASGFANDRWQHANMNDVMGLVNGEDAPQTFDGSTVSAMTVQAAMGEPALTVSELIGITVHRSRSYFIRDSDSGFWFSAVNALGGDLEFFPLGAVQGVGGHLVAMVSWTRDGGEGGGTEDLAVFLMSSGQAVLYRGSDPGTAADWALVGVFAIGAPIGRRCVLKIGGEAVVITVDGYTQLSRVLPGGRTARDVNVSDKLGKLVLDAARINSGSFGWQPIHYPRGRRALVNHPVGGGFEQHVVNLATGAWGRFRGMNASCWSLFGERLFFGTAAGQILEADVGTSDLGAMIAAVGQNAFWSPRQRNIQVNTIRPLFEATGSLSAKIDIYADYSPVPYATVDATFGAVGGGGGKWNTFKWNTTPWASPSKTVQSWIGHAARGYAISPAVRVDQKNDRIAWSGTSLTYTPTGII